MTLDLLDRAFVSRSPARSPLPSRRQVAEMGAPMGAGEAGAVTATTAAEEVDAAELSAASLPEAVASDLVDRLLEQAPAAWQSLAARVEQAHAEGLRVVAVAGAERGEGRTTVVAGIARALQRRGRRVVCSTQAPLVMEESVAPPDDKTIVLVDAGVWFPPGPVRRKILARFALGCDTLLFVRRQDVPECLAYQQALAAIGMPVLGVVLTFAGAGEGSAI